MVRSWKARNVECCLCCENRWFNVKCRQFFNILGSSHDAIAWHWRIASSFIESLILLAGKLRQHFDFVSIQIRFQRMSSYSTICILSLIIFDSNLKFLINSVWFTYFYPHKWYSNDGLNDHFLTTILVILKFGTSYVRCVFIFQSFTRSLYQFVFFFRNMF